MERQGLGIRGWGLRITGSGLGIEGRVFRTLLNLAILFMWSATALAAPSGSEGENELGINVRVYDYARVGRGTLITTEKLAASIFRKAGLAMNWCSVPMGIAESILDSICEQPAGHAELKLRIVPRLKVMRGATVDLTEGFAMGNVATVSYHWVQEADPAGGAMPPEILACIIAHEIGHLLLGPNSHSRTGIMRGEWSHDALRDAGEGLLQFTPQQAEILRAEVLARSGERRASIAQMPASQP